MTRAARIAYPVLAWLFLVALTAQIFIAGLALFAGSENWATHVNLGWIVHLLPIPVLLAAWLARAGRRHWQWALALALVVFAVPLLVLARDAVPALAALHPVLAMVGAWLGFVVAIRSLEVLRAGDSATGPDSASAA